jgi:hypothetical protein
MYQTFCSFSCSAPALVSAAGSPPVSDVNATALAA